jgi:hypothetical protein
LARSEKFNRWLEDNGCKISNSDEYYIHSQWNKKILYKKISEFIIE